MLTNLAALGDIAQIEGSEPVCSRQDIYAVVLAPLSGITDVPFRRLVRSFGLPLVFSEMVASGELVRGSAESFLRAQATGSGLHAVQLAGREPQAMEDAARRLAAAGAGLIDINMGCPAKKVVGGASGAALMRDLDLACRLVAATVQGAGGVPVSVKMRLGWDRASLNAADLIRIAANEGARRVTLHGRTRDQFYEGRADWDAIGEVAAASPLPVTANGDLVSAGQLVEMRRRSGCESVMIGRGACGRPWLPALLAGHTDLGALRNVDLGHLVVEHYEAMLAHYGTATGARHARKHLGWYLQHLARLTGELSGETAAILQETDPRLVARRLWHLFGGVAAAEIETELSDDKAA